MKDEPRARGRPRITRSNLKEDKLVIDLIHGNVDVIHCQYWQHFHLIFVYYLFAAC